MGNNRVDTVAYDVITAIRDVMIKHEVTHAEYLAAQEYLQTFLLAEPYEIPLATDIFFDATVHDIEMKSRRGSVTNTLGPYFKPDCPSVTTALKVLANKPAEPMIIEGRVMDLEGRPIKGAELFLWHSDPDGYYSGFAEHMPNNDYYRGRVEIPEDGRYSLTSTVPYPYTIPHDGPTGALLRAMGRHPWRPAHIHFIVNAKGFSQHVTQVYFASGEYNETDCAESVRPELVFEFGTRDGAKVIHKDFYLDPV